MKKTNGSLTVLLSSVLATVIVSLSPAAHALPETYEVLKGDCTLDYVNEQLRTMGTVIDTLTSTAKLSESPSNIALRREVNQSVNAAMDLVFSACAKVRLAEIQQKQQ